MSSYTMEDLVSQAETEGVTLAQVISSKLSADDLERIEEELKNRIEDNYRSIAEFMDEISVPSGIDFSSVSEEELTEMQLSIAEALSDGLVCD